MGDWFSLDKVNLAEPKHCTGILNQKLLRPKPNEFVALFHGFLGKKATVTLVSEFTGMISDLLSLIWHEDLDIYI